MLKDKVTITYNLDEVADSLEEGIDFLKKHNINSAEIRTINKRNIVQLSIEETKSLKEILNSNGLTVSSIASPLFKWYSGRQVSENKVDLFGVSPFLSVKEKKLMIRKVIDQACILETDKIRIFSGLKPKEGKSDFPKEESELLIFALKLAKEKDVQLMLENEPVCYISKIKDYISIFTSKKYRGLRSWFDIANVYEEGETISQSDLDQLAPYIDYLHLKDPVALMNHRYVPLGKGYVNYKRIFDILESTIDSSLYISIETHVKNDKWDASHESLKYLHKLLEIKRIQYALVGVGRISRKHFKAIKENLNCTLVGVYDIDYEKSQLASLAHDCVSYKTYQNLLDDKQVKVVSICTPHLTHIDIINQALKNKKKVLCEKPLALNLKDLNRFILKHGENPDIFVVFQNKFNPAIKKLYDFEIKKLGEPQYIAIAIRWWRDLNYYKDWHGGKESSGGALITQAIHSLELITHLTKGAAIKSVRTLHTKTRNEIKIPDIIVAIIEFENRIICNIEVCLATKKQNLESSIFVVGKEASIKVAGVALSDFVHPNNNQDVVDNKNDNHYYGNGHFDLYKTHANHCLQISDPDHYLLTRPSDLVNVFILIESIEKSLNI
jgi:predicted dehydrogenase/sugar phosphate isomerase/epimerase